MYGEKIPGSGDVSMYVNWTLVQFELVSGRQGTKVEGCCFFSIQVGQLLQYVLH